jgi:hypothetical protein
VFRDEDWARLKKIGASSPIPFVRHWLTLPMMRAADGNPDEDKIGAFGVGTCIWARSAVLGLMFEQGSTHYFP